MKKMLLSLLAMLCLSILTMEAQSQKIAGVVFDELGEPLIGASVVIKGTQIGVVADADGRFELNVNDPQNQTLIISYFGFETLEIPIYSKTEFEIVLKTDVTQLDELVVVGYGVQKKALVTGANLAVKGEDITELRTGSAMEALQGIAPGVSVTRDNGAPGAGTKVTIRGMGTIGNSSPLYVVDGVSLGSIDHLSPSDIESINVLKDAASAAIYGSRAANGVVLVTTKKAKKGEAVSVTYDGYYGLQNVYKLLTPLNAQEYMMILDERRTNDGLTPYDWEDMIVNGNQSMNTLYGGTTGTDYGRHVWDKLQGGWEGTNWLKEITTKNASVQNHTLNVSGSSDRIRYFAGASYYDQEGIIGGNVTDAGYERITLRLNTDMVLYKNAEHNIITIGENLTYTNSENRQVAMGDMWWNDFHNALVANPLTPLYYDNEAIHKDTNGWAPTLQGISMHQHNPVAQMYYRNNFNYGRSNSITGNVFIEIEPIKNLKLRSSYGVESWFGNSRSYSPIYRLGDNASAINDEVSQSSYLYASSTWNTTLSYGFQKNGHSFDALVGMEMIKTLTDVSMGGSHKNTIFEHPDYAYLSNCKQPNGISDFSVYGSDGTAEGGGLMSYMVRVSYNYKERYMIDAVMRADGSSVFSPKNRWGYFPSVSAGWNFSNEEWMKNAKALSDGKIRVSWGQNGNNSIASFTYLSQIVSMDKAYYFGEDKVASVNGSQPFRVPNPDIKWETSEQFNVGLDLNFFDYRLGFVADYYRKTTKDWLVVAPVLGTFGLEAPYINGGDVLNTGVELALSWRNKVGNFSYGISASAAYNKNTVTHLNNAEKTILGSGDLLAYGTSYVSRVEEGMPIGYFYGYKTDGILQNQDEVDAYVGPDGNPIIIGSEKDVPRRPGDVRFIDSNNDGVIDDNDKTYLGKPTPDWELGLQLNAEWKGIYLNTTLTGKLGMQVMQSYHTYLDQRENYTTEVFNRWHGEGTSNRMPRLSNTATANYSLVSDIYMHDADYLRINNLTIGYKFDNLLRNNKVLHGLSLYVTFNNLYTFTKYDGMDPEVGFGGGSSWASGIDLGLYPLPRTVLFGLTIKL